MAMVIPALQYQTSPEQREKWLPLATSFKILGAYVQTELGHGSNVRALETTATFDQVLQTVDECIAAVGLRPEIEKCWGGGVRAGAAAACVGCCVKTNSLCRAGGWGVGG